MDRPHSGGVFYWETRFSEVYMITEDTPDKVADIIRDTWPQLFRHEMANSPVDKGKEFIKSGMTLITEQSSDRLLKKSKEKAEKAKGN